MGAQMTPPSAIRANAAQVSTAAVPAGTAAVLTCAAFARIALGGVIWAPIDVVLMSALVALGALTMAQWQGGGDALGLASASIFPSLYLGLPIGAMIAIRESRGREAL